MKTLFISMLSFLLLLSIVNAAPIDIWQNTHYSVNATTAIDPGPRGVGGLLTAINTSVGPGVQLYVSGTWFQEDDVIIVDAFVIQNDNPVSGANCTISIKNDQFTEVLSNAPMDQNTIAAEPHYTYNTTNISALGGLEGKYFGHVRCQKAPPNPFVIYSESDFEVQAVGSPIIREIQNTRDLLQSLLDRQFDFSQEEVFLVTDAFNTMSNLLEAVESGKISKPDAAKKLASTENMIKTRLGEKAASQTITPKSSAFSSFTTSITKAPKIITQSILKNFIYKLIVILLLANVAVAMYKRRRRDIF